ncbi:YczE/YyaS/YitT family protein [Pontibacter chitinilyticus]|uniref:YczE/YyaS/YitT family protein n=1 Tax=Pontibacter chitinilyticus TaxID=2674989 RepID=UPI0032190484
MPALSRIFAFLRPHPAKQKQGMRERVIQYIFFFSGLLLFGFGNAIAVKVKYLGLHPWEVLHVALYQKLGLSIGTWSAIVGLLLTAVSWFIDRKYVNIGTFLNALLIGPIMDFFLWLQVLPEASHTYRDFLQLACAIVVVGIAGGLYVAAGIGAGPRDGFMLSMAERTGLSVAKARIAVEFVVMVIGFLLGGPIFVATFFYSLIQSPIFQVMLRYFKRLRATLTGQQVPA